MFILKGLVGLVGLEPFNFSLFSVTGWGIDLDYCDIEWFALIILSFLRLHPSTAFHTLLLTLTATPFLLSISPFSEYSGLIFFRLSA